MLLKIRIEKLVHGQCTDTLKGALYTKTNSN